MWLVDISNYVGGIPYSIGMFRLEGDALSLANEATAMGYIARVYYDPSFTDDVGTLDRIAGAW